MLHVLPLTRTNALRISVSFSGDAPKTEENVTQNNILDVMKLNANREADIAPLFAG